jgi:hypothetical protein
MECTIGDLLNEYRQADFTKRLHLYLQYPELRTEFADMEREALHAETRNRTQGSECCPRPFGVLPFRSRSGCVKRLLGVAQGRI